VLPGKAARTVRPEPAPRGDRPSIVFLDDLTPAPATPPAPQGPSADRFLLWVDACGGFLVCPGSEVVLGRAGHDSSADVPLLGDLSRRHAILVRQGDAYIVRALHPTFVNGKPVVGQAALKDRDVIRLGGSVELLFRQPSPVSATARLEIVSRHRMPLAVDGVVLMAETCILASGRQAHVSISGVPAPIILFRQGEQLGCRSAATLEIDGRQASGRVLLGERAAVRGDGFSFSLEPLGSKTT
jgi:hypothetical protein